MAEFIFVLGRKNGGNESLLSYLRKVHALDNISDFLSVAGDTNYFVNIYESVCENLDKKDIEFLLMPDVEKDLLDEIALKKRPKPLKSFKDYLESFDKTNNQLQNLAVSQSV